MISSHLLQGHQAVVTGGAGAIGNAVCTLFALQGADIIVVDSVHERAADVVQRVREAGGRAVPVVCDLTTQESIDAVATVAFDEFGGIDILINALGDHLGSTGPFEDSTPEQWQALYEVNLLHVLRTTHAFLPSMKTRKWGRIVNFSSVEGIRSAPQLSVYAAFKRGVDGFTKSLAVEVAGDGVLVNAIALDKVRSYQTGHFELPEEYTQLVPTWIPVGRYGEPDDVARVALFLASDLNSWMTGQTLVADGGTLSAGGWFRTPKRWTTQPLLVQYLEDPAINETRPPLLQ